MLMLAHHLFINYHDLWVDFHFGLSSGLAGLIGGWSKVCVCLFVFLSGYGLMKSTQKGLSLGKFFRHRFARLWLNYWFIYLIFVPMGVLFFNRTFEAVYGDNVVLYGILDFFGVLDCFARCQYNTTWWFYSCIILLYLLFPLLRMILTKWRKAFIALTALAVICCILPLHYGILQPIRHYLYTFMIGMIIATMRSDGARATKKARLIMYISLLPLLLARYKIVSLQLDIDTLVALLIIAIYMANVKEMNAKIKTFFAFVGKHSFNIFLFHTFICNIYFTEFTYSFRYPPIIFAVLLGICLLISVLMEKVKRTIGFYRLEAWISGRK